MDIIKQFEPKFRHTLEYLKEELGALRVGRASPVLVEDIELDIYGVKQRLKAMAAITTPDARTILIRPWDKSSLSTIELAIRNAPQGFSPVVDQDMVRVQLSPLTEEKRRELKKVLGQKVESARIKLRKIRDELWGVIQDLAKKKEISEDEKFRLKGRMEDTVKKFNEDVRNLEKRKTEEFLKL